MSFIKKWLGIKKPKKVKLEDVKQKPIRMGGAPQVASLDARERKRYWDDQKLNSTKLTGLGGGGNLFS